jgi:hypothetical protein
VAAVEIWKVHPILRDGSSTFFIMADDGRREVLSFKGLYGDVRDCDVCRRIAALPDLVEVARRAASAILVIHADGKQTGSGNAVMASITSSGHKGKLFLESLSGRDVSGVEALTMVVDEADAVARELFDSVCEAANQIDYMIEKFDLAGGFFDEVRAEIEAAVAKADAAGFVIDDPAEAARFREWEVFSREILDGKLKQFAR